MKLVFLIIKEQIEKDFKWSTYGYLFFFLLISITFNYIYDFEDLILDAHLHRFSGFLYYTLFYAMGYYGVAIPQLLILNKKHILLKRSYWVRTIFFISVCGFSASFYVNWFLNNSGLSNGEYRYLNSLLMNMSCFFTTLLPLFLFWFFVDKGKGSFYGFRFKHSNLKPYLLMLGLMLPLLLWASFQEDFQSTYPTLKTWNINHPFGLNDFSVA